MNKDNLKPIGNPETISEENAQELNQEQDSPFQRKIRSFVRREGRLTKGQQHALDTLWSTMGVDYQENLLDFTTLFGNNHPVVVEIGFGMGASLVEMAHLNPDYNYLGIEVHRPGVGACLSEIERLQLSNIKLICHDAVEVFDHMLPPSSVALVQLFFPDPWHKKRHNKRRIVQLPFTEMVRQRLSIGGVLHLATDWEPYAEHMLAIMRESRGYQNRSATNDYILRPDNRPLTKFEKRGHGLGHGVWDLQFKRIE